MSSSLLPIAAGALVGFGIGAFGVGLKSREPERQLESVSKSSEFTSSQFGLPAIHAANIGPVHDYIQRQAYVLAYDRRTRIPSWTAEHLTAASLKSEDGSRGNRAESSFMEDTGLPEPFRARLTDYFRSGYDRGHMVPAADAKKSQTAMNETFILSNIAPQVGEGFNRHYWAYLESFCRGLTHQFQDVYIFTVPLFLPKKFPDNKWRVTYEVIGESPNVAVPTHFAKVVITKAPLTGSTSKALTQMGSFSSSDYSVAAFVLPNAPIPDDTPLTSFVTPVDAVERAAGLSLIPEDMKANAKHLCMTTKCELVIRRFDDARKKAIKSS